MYRRESQRALSIFKLQVQGAREPIDRLMYHLSVFESIPIAYHKNRAKIESFLPPETPSNKSELEQRLVQIIFKYKQMPVDLPSSVIYRLQHNATGDSLIQVGEYISSTFPQQVANNKPVKDGLDAVRPVVEVGKKALRPSRRGILNQEISEEPPIAQTLLDLAKIDVSSGISHEQVAEVDKLFLFTGHPDQLETILTFASFMLLSGAEIKVENSSRYDDDVLKIIHNLQNVATAYKDYYYDNLFEKAFSPNNPLRTTHVLPDDENSMLKPVLAALITSRFSNYLPGSLSNLLIDMDFFEGLDSDIVKLCVELFTFDKAVELDRLYKRKVPRNAIFPYQLANETFIKGETLNVFESFRSAMEIPYHDRMPTVENEHYEALTNHGVQNMAVIDATIPGIIVTMSSNRTSYGSILSLDYHFINTKPNEDTEHHENQYGIATAAAVLQTGRAGQYTGFPASFRGDKQAIIDYLNAKTLEYGIAKGLPGFPKPEIPDIIEPQAPDLLKSAASSTHISNQTQNDKSHNKGTAKPERSLVKQTLLKQQSSRQRRSKHGGDVYKNLPELKRDKKVTTGPVKPQVTRRSTESPPQNNRGVRINFNAFSLEQKGAPHSDCVNLDGKLKQIGESGIDPQYTIKYNPPSYLVNLLSKNLYYIQAGSTIILFDYVNKKGQRTGYVVYSGSKPEMENFLAEKFGVKRQKYKHKRKL